MTDDGQEMSEAALAALCEEMGDVTAMEVKAWMARGWFRVRVAPDGPTLTTNVAARLVLIREMRRDLGIDEGSLDVVLDLIDKLRLQTLKLDSLNAAMEAADADAQGIRQAAAGIFRERLRKG